MRVISRKTLKDFWNQHPEARQPLQAWYADVKQAKGTKPVDIKEVYSNASFLANNRVVFNIKGNKYRLVVAIQYDHGLVYIRFVGSNREYDKINVSTI